MKKIPDGKVANKIYESKNAFGQLELYCYDADGTRRSASDSRQMLRIQTEDGKIIQRRETQKQLKKRLAQTLGFKAQADGTKVPSPN